MKVRPHKSRAGLRRYSFVVDGKSEIWYFQLMKQHESLNEISVEPVLPTRKKLRDQFFLVKENADVYDRVYWIVDFDVILKETRECRPGGKSRLVELGEYMMELRERDNVRILINNPCLEFWFLLHFKETSHFYGDCSSVCRALKHVSLFSDYVKNEQYYKKNDGDIYLKLKPFQENAIRNSSKLGKFDFSLPDSAKSEMFKLFVELGVGAKITPPAL